MKKINDNSMPFLGNNTTNHNIENRAIKNNKDNSMPYLGNDSPTSQNLEGKVIMKKIKDTSMPFLGNNTTNHNLENKAIRNIKDNTMPYLGNDAPVDHSLSNGNFIKGSTKDIKKNLGWNARGDKWDIGHPMSGQGGSGGSREWRDVISASDTLSRINSSERLGGRR